MLHNLYTNLTPRHSQEETSEADFTSYIHPLATVVGDVYLGENVVVASVASIRSSGYPIRVGDDTNVQDNVVLHSLETFAEGVQVRRVGIEIAGKLYGIYIGDRVSLAPKCQVYGPVKIGSDTFIGKQVLVFKAMIGSNCVLEPKAAVMEVTISDGRYVPAGSVITSQVAADNLPLIDEAYRLKDLNKAVVCVNVQLAKDYRKKA